MKSLSKNISINVLDYFLTLLVMVISSRIIVNYLGDELYGLYSSITVFITGFMLVEAGIGISISHFFAKCLKEDKKDDSESLITTSFLIYFLLSIIVFLFFSILEDQIVKIFFGDLSLISFNLILIPSLIVLSFFYLPFNSYFMATDNWLYMTIANLSSKVFNITAIVLLYVYDLFTIENLFISLFISLLFKVILGCLFYIKGGNSFGSPKVKIMNNIFKYISFSSIQFFCAFIIFYSDKIFLKKTLSFEVLGYVNFCFLVGSYIHTLYGNIYRTFFTRFVYSNEGRRRDVLIKSVMIFFILSIFLNGIVYFLWLSVIGNLINYSFASETYYFIPLVLILNSIRILEIALHYYYHGSGKPKVLAGSSFLLAFLLLVSYDYSIDIFSSLGTLIPQVVLFLIIYITLFFWTILHKAHDEDSL